MTKIIRTKTQALGGITVREKKLMDEHAKLWISRAMRTAPIEPGKIIPAIAGLYAAAGLKIPRIVIVPSPLVMALAYEAAFDIWTGRKINDDATHATTYATTYAATDDATYAATARKWISNYQGGNMWCPYDCYLTAFRDILGLDLPSHTAYAHWEQAAIHGGFRAMHKEFCIVSDFPEILCTDEQNRPHCANGPSHRWRDGWSLYYWHGVRIPAHWIEQRESLDPAEVMREPNIEKRAAGIAIIGWPRMIKQLKHKIIDGDPDTDIGALIELTFPGLREPGRFLQAVCPRNGTIVEGVPYVSDIDRKPINTAIAAQAWRDGLPASEYQHPLYRT